MTKDIGEGVPGLEIPGPNDVFGDTFADNEMLGNDKGKKQTVLSVPEARVYGDAFWMLDRSKGGNDTLIATDDPGVHRLIGDARFMCDRSKGGNDTLMADGDGQYLLSGDAGLERFHLFMRHIQRL